MLCTLALVAFFAVLARELPAEAVRARLAVTLAAAGGGVDLFCDTLYITVLPSVASGGPSDEMVFLTVERMALAGGLIVANGMYSLGTLLLTLDLRGHERVTHLLTPLGYGTFACGMLLVVAGFINSAWLAAVATGPTIGLYCAWVLVVARAFRQPGGGP
jgi:hypothetical protein